MPRKRTERQKKDPTGMGRNRLKAANALRFRLGTSQRQVLKLFRGIPRKRRQVADIVNNRVVYDYELTATQLAELNDQVEFILNDQLLESQDDPFIAAWFWSKRIEQPYRAGTAQETNTINQLIAAATVAGIKVDGLPIRTLDLQSILFSEPYREAVAKALAEQIPIIKGLSADTARDISGVINRGISSGLTPKEISDQIKERFSVAESKADRIASTEVNKAYNNAKMRLGKQAGDEIGVKTAVLHISALLPTTREHHAARHGNTYTVEAQTQWWDTGANRINCFVPGTEVSGRFTAGAKSYYSGKVVKLMTRDGRSLTVTPNHKVMTDAGLVVAAEINEGSYLLAYRGEVEDSTRVCDLDGHKVNPTIEDVFSLLSDIGCTLSRRIIGEDFNGDGRGMDKDIDTVFADRVLTIGDDTAAFEALDNLKLIHANSPAVRLGSLLQRLKGILTTPSSIVSAFGVIHSFCRGHIFSSAELSRGLAAGGKASLFESAHYDWPGNADFLGKLQNTLPCGVLLDEVINVDVFDFSGHVYDLQEESGLMLANGIIASNCHCTTQTVLVDRKGQPLDKEFQDLLKGERVFFRQ